MGAAIPIRIKFDERYQQVKLEDSYDEGFFEDGEDYLLDSDELSIDLGIEDLDLGTGDFNDISLTDE